MSPPNVLVCLSSGQHLSLQWRCKKSLQKTLQNNLMIGKISFCTCGTDSLSVMSGGLYPCFGSVGNQRTSAEKPSGDKVSQGVFILSALLLKYQLILSWNRSIHKVWGMYIAIMRLKSQKTFLKKKKIIALSKSLSIYLTQHHIALFYEHLVLQYPYTLLYLVMLNFTDLLIKAKL